MDSFTRERLLKKHAHLEHRENYLESNCLNNFYKHKCLVEYLELRKRILKNNSISYVYQCLICGRQSGGAIKKDIALKNISSNKLTLDYDDTIEEKYTIKKKRILDIIVAIRKQKNEIYNKYIGKESSNNDHEDFLKKAKKEKEKLQILIDDFYNKLESSFADSRFKYDSIHRELAYLKIRVTNKIIEKAKEMKINLFKSEPEINIWFKEYFKEDFYMEAEVSGVHTSEKQNVKIDYILKPKQHLIDNGFVNECFGVEIKYIDPESSDLAKKANKAIWQTISYNDCKFDLKNKRSIKPKFCMIFSNLSFNESRNLFKEFEHAHNYRIWFYYLLLANHANVGELRVKGTRDKPTGWTFKFGNSGAYFNKNIDKENNVTYSLQNEELVYKKRIGNFQ